MLAASRDGGTNALLQPLPPLIPYAFGVKSFARHQELAMQAGCRLRLYASPTIAYDLDRPTDLTELTKMQGFPAKPALPLILRPTPFRNPRPHNVIVCVTPRHL